MGAFRDAGNAQAFRDRLGILLEPGGDSPQITLVQGLYRVRLGPYPDAARQAAAASRVRDILKLSPTLVGP